MKKTNNIVIKEKTTVKAGEKLELKNGEIWTFATDSFEEYTELIRVIKFSERQYQNRDFSRSNSVGAKKLLQNLEKQLFQEILQIEKELIYLYGYKTSNITKEIISAVTQEILENKKTKVLKGEHRNQSRKEDYKSYNNDRMNSKSEMNQLVKILSKCSKEILTINGIKACENEVIDSFVKRGSFYLGNILNDRTMYMAEKNKDGQTRIVEKISGLPHRIVLSAWLTLDQIVYNENTKRWNICKYE